MRPVDMMEILQAREERVHRQMELLAEYKSPLVCFTMNIAGPIKNSEEIAWGFQYGSRLLLRQLDRIRARVLYRQTAYADTGNEAYVVVDYDPDELKACMVELEDHLELGRLFDLDVLVPGGRKLERTRERGCLICGRAGKSCARSRAHSVEELQSKTRDILIGARQQWKRESVGELACRALLYEACTTPKPGLVDCRNNGSHDDMDLFSFLSSAAALQPYFSHCVDIGEKTRSCSPEETFAALRWPGKQAELRMLEATDGVNTHKGAIFTMGVVCGAVGRLEMNVWENPSRIMRECAAMTAGLTERELNNLSQGRTAGESLFLKYQTTGIRGQLEAGLPAVCMYGLPALEQGLSGGKTLEQAGISALLTMLAHMDDTNLLKRGDMDALLWSKEQAERLLKLDTVCLVDLEALDDAFIERKLSPGGAADLLAVCYFFHFLQMEKEFYPEI